MGVSRDTCSGLLPPLPSAVVVVSSLPGYGQTGGHTLDREEEDDDGNDVEISDLPRRDMLCCAALLRDMM